MSKEYISFLTQNAKEFIKFQTASGRWNDIYDRNLRSFDRHCATMYSDVFVLTQEMVDSWCTQRSEENGTSCGKRVQCVRLFIRYLQCRGKTDVNEPEIPQPESSTYIAHAFTELELSNFFLACDSLPSTPRTRTILTRKIIVPTFFRLLYSSGIRTIEARRLGMDDVDLCNGVLNIRESKGDDQHYVALHETTTELLRQYNAAIRKLYPDRVFFFPSSKQNGKELSPKWVNENFNMLWYKYNTQHAIPYELRHNYAVENINKWNGKGFDFLRNFLALSKSMGHSTLQSTKYYYHLVPAMSDILLRLTGKDFDRIVPEVDYEES